MKATDAQVEELARWLDATYLTLRCRSYGWGQMAEDDRESYRFVARALLERPPPPLPDALGGCAPDAVAGRAAP
jgi:hypothetical protein